MVPNISVPGPVLPVTKPVGVYLCSVLERKTTWLDPIRRPLEGLVHGLCGIDESKEMKRKEYGAAMLVFGGVSSIPADLVTASVSARDSGISPAAA